MRIPLTLALLCLSTLAEAAPQDGAKDSVQNTVPRISATAIERLSLRQAIELGLRGDPGVLQALSQKDRGDLAVLRAQLDRVSLKVDANLSEQYRLDNLVGRQGAPSCAAILPIRPLLGSDLVTPIRLLSPTSESGIPTEAECASAMGGVYSPASGGAQGSGIGVFNVTANLFVPIFSGFRVTANVDRAKHQREAASANIKIEQRRLAGEVLRAYWNVRRAELQLQVSQAASDRYAESVKVVSARVRAGLVPQVDINRIETRRQRELARQADLRGAAAEARAQLAVLLGLPPGTQIELTENADVPPSLSGASADQVDPAEIERLLDEAQRNRPETLLAKMQILAGKDLVKMQMSGYYPQLSGQAWLQFGNNLFNPLAGFRTVNDSANPFANINGSAFLGANLSINLFDTLNTYTSVRDARYEVQRLEQDQRRLGRLIEADVRTTYARLYRLYQSREILSRTRELAADTLNVVERRYKNGDALVLDYLDAQLDLLASETDLANSAASIAQTWGELRIATGRLPGTQDLDSDKRM